MYRNKTNYPGRRREGFKNAAMVSFLTICLAFLIGMPVYNTMTGTDRSSWYVEGGHVEIAAMPLQTPVPEEAHEALEPESRREDIPAPTATPEPVYEPEVTLEPMDAIQPEATLEPQPQTITITAVGDCTLGGNVPSGGDHRFDGYVEKYGYDYFFKKVKNIFEADDLTIINLEGPLTTSNAMRENRQFNFRGKTAYTKILTGSSVEICNVANNHAYDFGKAGLIETAKVLDAAGVGCSGFDKSYTTTVKGVKITSLGFTQWDYTAKQVESACKKAKKNCDILIVSVHWGIENAYTHTDLQRKLGEAAIDGGADVVLGHHPHVYGGVDKYKGKYIVYSLGNFCFGGNGNPKDYNTLIFQQTFNVSPDGEVTDGGINIIPASVSSTDSKNNFQPVVLGEKKGEALLKKVAQYSSLSMTKTLWMEDSYMAKLGYVEEPAAEPEIQMIEAAQEDAEATV